MNRAGCNRVVISAGCFKLRELSRVAGGRITGYYFGVDTELQKIPTTAELVECRQLLEKSDLLRERAIELSNRNDAIRLRAHEVLRKRPHVKNAIIVDTSVDRIAY